LSHTSIFSFHNVDKYSIYKALCQYVFRKYFIFFAIFFQAFT